MKQATSRIMLAISLLGLWCSNVLAADKPMKVYILAGQSNMVGYGAVNTFDYLGLGTAASWRDLPWATCRAKLRTVSA